jgi:hypothetical protein
MRKSWKEYYLFICCCYFHASFCVFESIWLAPALGNKFPVIAPPFHPPPPSKDGWNKDNFNSITHMSYYCIRWFQDAWMSLFGNVMGFMEYVNLSNILSMLDALIYARWMKWLIFDFWVISCMECPSINVGTTTWWMDGLIITF